MNILFLIIAIAIVVVYFFFQYRFKEIVKYLDLLKTTIITKKPLSYKIEFTVSPNWTEIIKWYFPKLNTDIEVWEFIAKCTDDPKIKLDKKRSLYEKDFCFVEFYDGVSGLNSIWSYHYEKFMSDRQIFGWILNDEEKILGILDEINTHENEKSDYLEISPSHIATRRGGDTKETISEIPYHYIESFFIKIYEEIGNANLQIKKFPKDMQKVFDEAKIVYEPRLDTHMGDFKPKTKLLKSESKWVKDNGVEVYLQNVEYHTFKTIYFAVSFKLEFFSPKDTFDYNF